MTVFDDYFDELRQKSQPNEAAVEPTSPTTVGGLDASIRAVGAGEQAPTRGDAIYSGFIDTITFGTADAMAAAENTATEYLFGDLKTADISKHYNQQKELMNLGFQKAKEAYPLSSFASGIAGDVVGGFGLAGVAVKAAKKVGPSVYRKLFGTALGRVVTGGSLAATQAGVYTWNSDGTIEEIGQNAALAAAGGVFLGAALEGAVGVGRFAKKHTIGLSTDKIREIAGKELFFTIDRALRKSAAQGEVPQEIYERMIRDPNAILPDLIPETLPILREVAAYPDADTALINVLRTRNVTEEVFQDQILGAIASPVMPRTKTAHAAYVKEHKKLLQPQYAEALQNSSVRVKSANMHKSVKQQFASGTTADNKAKNFLTAQIRRYNSKADGNTVSLSDMQNIKLNLNEEINKVIKKGRSATPFIVARNRINDFIGEHSEDYARLNFEYGDWSDVDTAYKAGRNMMSNKSLNDTDLKNYMTTDKSATSVDAFVEGAKSQVYQTFKSVDGPKKAVKLVNSNDFKNKMTVVLGNDGFAAFKNFVEDAASKEVTRETFNAALTATQPKQDLSSPTQALLDTNIVANTVLGRATGVASSTAAGRLLRSAPNKEAIAGVMSDMLATKAQDATKFIENIQNLGEPSLPNILATGAYSGLGRQDQEGLTGPPQGRQSKPLILDYLDNFNQ